MTLHNTDNLSIYNNVRIVPVEAQKKITGGRLNGKTDINPMWRIKTLTEQFGPCGFGWKYVITKQWIEEGANNEKAAFVNIDLFIKFDDKWSEPIPGTGGSMFVASEKAGPYTSDECFKMALTDAISVSCKALGVGADIYWQADATKYNSRQEIETSHRQRTAQIKASEGMTVEQAAGIIISFGKHQGKKLGDIYKESPDYVKWFLEKGTDPIIKKAFQLLCDAVEQVKKRKAQEKQYPPEMGGEEYDKTAEQELFGQEVNDALNQAQSA